MLIRSLEYDRGLNLLDAPDMGDHLFIGRDDELELRLSAASVKDRECSRQASGWWSAWNLESFGFDLTTMAESTCPEPFRDSRDQQRIYGSVYGGYISAVVSGKCSCPSAYHPASRLDHLAP
jgi:hypothetical protein